ncbi:MAG TPA: pitrilysin family protein [Thermoanaerobaculia bacterium]|nr:pitrilysin family protein [Thermoanaerobaculia bacterium]
MNTLKRHAVAAATLLLALASPAFSQVTKYTEIKTPSLRTFTVEQPKRIALGNGMIIFLQEDHELPLIRGSALIRGGERDVPATKSGLANIYGQAWRTGGTESKTGDELDDFLEARAARIETGGGEDSTRISFDVLKGDFDTVFRMFVELMQKPAFRQDKIDLAKTQARTAISRRNDDPGQIRSREAAKLGYGADSPYGRTAEYATVAAITRDDLLAFHDRFVAPNNIIIGIVGDFDSAAMENKLRAAFGSWKRGTSAPATIPPAGTAAKPGVYYVAKDDVTQSNISVLHPATILRKDPDYYAAAVLNEILSGGFSGRLMSHIRSQAGLAYGVGGGISAGWDRPALFNVSMSTKSPSTIESIGLVKKEIRDLQTTPFTADELAHAKDTILNAFVFTMDSKAKVLNQRVSLEFYGYPADYWQKYQHGIEAVTAADVERVAKKYIHPDQLAVLVVGNEKDFDKPLSTVGNVTPIDVTIPDGSPKPAGGSSQPAAEKADASALVKKVQDFVGGKAALDKVQATKIVRSMTTKTPAGDMDVEMEQTVQYPDSIYQVVKTPMGEMTSVITPSAAFMNTPMGMQDMPASARAEAKFDLLTILKSPEKYTFAAVGSEKVGDVNATIVTATLDGASTKWYVEPATGRILRTARNTARGEVVADYADWKPFGGINLPTSLTLSINGEKQGSATVKTVEVNPTVDPKIFQKPATK